MHCERRPAYSALRRSSPYALEGHDRPNLPSRLWEKFDMMRSIGAFMRFGYILLAFLAPAASAHADNGSGQRPPYENWAID
ncbi:hypothetical protein M2310_005955 [Rhizobium leguminosarum]|uniref:Uncharacterized protein n=1 Tax=Rhizobium esperanzae TaxID=1967781 RepID=A0A7W6UQH3_9HYPH|nr:hypothetical protein [Rhizobium esperanzae]MDH6205268.1 hypothetical protein [Rhizobium leguminosarum]